MKEYITNKMTRTEATQISFLLVAFRELVKQREIFCHILRGRHKRELLSEVEYMAWSLLLLSLQESLSTSLRPRMYSWSPMIFYI